MSAYTKSAFRIPAGTYEEGKKIGARDGFRALYCILKYNAHKAPLPMQFLIYLFIGGVAAMFNLVLFLSLYHAGIATAISAPAAFVAAAIVNYVLCILLLFSIRPGGKRLLNGSPMLPSSVVSPG